MNKASNIENELEIMDNPAKSISMTFEYEKGGIVFNKQKLHNVIKKYRYISIKDVDNKNNPITIKDIVQLQVDVGLDDSTYEKIDGMQFNEIAIAISNKEEGTLNEY